MAAANPLESLQKEATCPICLEDYTDPVTTKCGHNFCRTCISACSEGEGTALSCPQCRALCPQGDLRANRQLQSMVELVKQLSVQWERPPGERLCAEQRERPPREGLCAKHEERLKLFCKEDEKLICVICRESKEHREHTVLPIEEAAEEYKPKLQEWLQTMRRELGAVQQDKQEEDKDYQAMRDKLEAERRKIETEFKRLQQLLKEQEQTLLRRLEEMDKKIAIVEKTNIAKLSSQISSFEALITEIEKKCEHPAEELLKDIRNTLNRCELVMDQAPAKNVKKYKVHVTLDDDTARDWLILSERPLKLGLYLDYEGGELSVYNADTMEALYTFTGAAFNGRVYPFFWVDGRADLRLV